MPKIAEMIGKKEKSFKPDDSRWPELIGIELELENVQGARDIPYWELKADGSLRNGVEYVLEAPYGGPSLQAAIDSYYGAKLRFDNSARTSTHVHINVLDTDLEAVRTLTMIVYMIEDALFNVVEGERKWAGYSMPLSEMNSDRLRTVLSAPWPDYGNKLLGALAPTKNQERYYGFNFAAARKYGTVEFRYFPGGPSKEELESWIDLIVALKRAAVAVGTPVALIDRLNNDQNVVEFLDEFLPGSWSNALLKQASAQAMLDKFHEVAALCTEFVLDRRDPMLFITPSLMKFIGTKMMVKEGLTYLEKLRPLGVMTADEWDFHYSKAVRLERGQKPLDDELELKAKIPMGRQARVRPYGEAPTEERHVQYDVDPWPDPAPQQPVANNQFVGFPPPEPPLQVNMDAFFDQAIRNVPPPTQAPVPPAAQAAAQVARNIVNDRRIADQIRYLEQDIATLQREADRTDNNALRAQYEQVIARKLTQIRKLRNPPIRPF